MIDSKTLEGLSSEEKRQLLKQILREKAAKGRPDLGAEATVEIPRFVAPVPPERLARPKTILLTGTTGFVGAFVLQELLARTDAVIYCLARARDDQDALRRIEANGRAYGIWDDVRAQRIVPIAGDLSNPALGLDEARLEWLQENVDVIYHVAAVVNLSAKYSVLKPSNVDGTLRILELAAKGRPKGLHYLSTYAIFDSIHNMRRTFTETCEPAEWRALSNGYAESKWVAEALVRRAQAAGLTASIYRVGWVIGHSRSGAWNKSDFIPRLIQCCTEVGMACSLGAMTMTPVDFLSNALVTLSLDPRYAGRIYHLSNGQRYSSDEIFEWTRDFGYAIEKVDYMAWDKAVRSRGHEIAVAPMLLFLDQAAGLDVKPADWFSNEPRYDASRTLCVLAELGVSCPTPGSALMAVYLAHFVRSGYLKPPVESRRESSVAAGEATP